MQLKNLLTLSLCLMSSTILPSPDATIREYQAQIEELAETFAKTQGIANATERGTVLAQVQRACNILLTDLEVFGEQIWAMTSMPTYRHASLKQTHKGLSDNARMLANEVGRVRTASPTLRPPLRPPTPFNVTPLMNGPLATS